MEGLSTDFEAHPLSPGFFTADASGGLIFDCHCVVAAVNLTFDEMVMETRPVKSANQDTIDHYLRLNLFNAVAMYWERSGSFPLKVDVERAMGEARCSLESGSLPKVLRAFDTVTFWLCKNYGKLTGDYAHSMQKSATYAEEKESRARRAIGMDLAESRFPKTIAPFVLPADLFADHQPGQIVLYRASVSKALNLGFNSLYDIGEDFYLLSRARREQWIAEYLKDCFRDVIFAAAERAQKFPTLDAVKSAAHNVNCDCGSGMYPTDGEALRLMCLLESEEHYYEMKAAFDHRKLNTHLSAKLADLPAMSPQSKPVL